MARLKWINQARPNQLAPPNGDWFGWLCSAGRGFGKTRIGAEEAANRALWNPGWRLAVVAPTQDDLRKTIFRGESGLLSVIPQACMRGGTEDGGYNSTHHELYLANGSVIYGFSAEKPGRLRGPQFHFAWCDEVAAWEPARMQETWDMLMFGLRLGTNPQVVVTSTPKPYPLVRDLHRRVGSDFVLSSGSTYENKANLAPTFFKQIVRYEGTELGKQEIHAELLDLSANAILKRPWWQIWAEIKLPKIEQIILSFDTAFKDAEESDATAMTAWGLFRPDAKDKDDEAPFHAILLHAWREKLLFPDLRERAQAEVLKWTIEDEPPDYVLIEDKGSGQSLIQELHRAGVKVRPYNPGRESKLMRAHVVSDILKAGMIWVPGKKLSAETRSDTIITRFGEEVVANCEVFRGMDGEEDDYVDTCTQAWSLMRALGVIDLPSDEEIDDPPPVIRDGPVYG